LVCGRIQFCCCTYIGRERSARDSPQHTQKAGIIRAANAWYLDCFLNKEHWRCYCLAVRLVCGRIRFWYLPYTHRQRGKAPGSIHRSIRKRRELSEQHMRGIYIISQQRALGRCCLAVYFVWFVAAFGFGAVHRQRKRRLGFVTTYPEGRGYQSSTCVVLFSQQ